MVDISVSPSMNRDAVTSCIFELYDLSSDRVSRPGLFRVALWTQAGELSSRCCGGVKECWVQAHCISKIALQCAKRQAASAHFLFDNVSW